MEINLNKFDPRKGMFNEINNLEEVPIISISAFAHGEWPARDRIPVDSDPIGDVINEVDSITDLRVKYGVISDNHSKCTHPRKYKNIISKSLKFWVCPDCKEHLGDC